MIRNNESKVLITTRNIKFYSNKGFICSIGEELSINISEMSQMSHNLVIAICEICESEVELSYCKYNINVKRGGFYSCKKCSHTKRKKTNLERHGVESITQRQDVRKKNKLWMSSDEFREKSNKSQINKYGCLFVQTDKFKEDISNKNKEIIKNKKEDGLYECPLSRSENNKLKKIGMLKKYGYKYSFQVKEIKEKIQNINLEKFGHISPLGNKDIQDNIKEIFVNKYGVDNPFKSKEIQDKIKKSRELKYNEINIRLFKEYRKSVRYYTNKNKNELFKNWTGYDYYDNEFIKDFIKENHNNPKYPTVDHKISCIYGFKNNISPEDISKIENLCITKRIINSKKSHLNEEEFLKIISLNK